MGTQVYLAEAEGRERTTQICWQQAPRPGFLSFVRAEVHMRSLPDGYLSVKLTD